MRSTIWIAFLRNIFRVQFAKNQAPNSLRYSLRSALLLLSLLLSSGLHAAVDYIYDANGRLSDVKIPTGESAGYRYDAAGNIVAIDRYAANVLKISSFSPASAAAGAIVVIRGNGFSTTASQNTVSFNGVAATVNAATATSLTAVVPATATTGKISVATSPGTVTSTADFRVLPLPVIQQIAPMMGSAGTAVTITGTGFESNAALDRISFNSKFAVITSASTTQLQTVVPANVSSGPITVRTSAGAAVSADFIVPPGTLAVGDISSVTRIAPDVAQAVSFQAGKTNLLTLAGGSNQLYSAQFSGLSLSSSSNVNWTLYAPDNTPLSAGVITSTSLSAHLPSLAKSGFYTLAIDANGGSGTVQIRMVSAVAIGINQPGLVGAVATAYQSTRFVFDATAGQNLGLAMSDRTWVPSSSAVSVTAYRPDGQNTVGNFGCSANGVTCVTNLTNLPDTGRYTIVVQPNGATGNFKLWLSTVTTASLVVDTPFSAVFTRPGEDLKLSFTGTAGQSLALQTNALTIPQASNLNFAAYKPDGTVLMAVPSASGTTVGQTTTFPTLPVTGAYTLYVEASDASTGGAQLLLKTGTTVTAGATVSATTISAAGASARFFFNGTAGQNLGLAVTDLLLTPASAMVANIDVYRPDGTLLIGGSANCYTSGGNCALNLANLPVTGRYSVVVQPTSGATGSFKLWLTALATGTMTINTSYTAAISRPGADRKLSFSGTAGQSLSLQVSALTLSPTTDSLLLTVYKPDGSLLLAVPSVPGTSAGQTTTLPLLPVTGTYTIYVEARSIATGSAQLLLKTPTALTAGAAASTTTISNAGASARFVFSGTAGQNLGLAVTELTLTPTSTTIAYINVYGPDGNMLSGGSTACYTNGTNCALNLANLPQTGQYNVEVQPAGGATGSFKLWLTALATGTMTIDTPYTASIARPGADLKLSFAGTAGQSLALQTSALTLSPTTDRLSLTAYNPDGSVLMYQTTIAGTSAGQTMTLPPLPVTGTYTLYVEALRIATGSAQLLLKTGTAVTAGAAVSTTTISNAGASARFIFSATAGQNLGLAVTDLALTPTSATMAYIDVYRPDGSALSGGSGGCYSNGTNCTFNLTNLPQTGQYSVLVQPVSGATGSFKLWLTALTTATLTIDTPYAATIARPGADLKLSFAGTAGQSLAFQTSAMTMSPTTDSLSLTAYKPDGSVLKYMPGVPGASAGQTTTLPPLPVTGTYTVYVEANSIATVSAQLLLKTGTAVTAGAAVSATTITNAGASARFIFNATAGQNLGLAVTDLALTPTSATMVNIDVYNPDGSALGGGSIGCYTNGTNCALNLANVPQTGQYSVLVQPTNNATGSFKLWLTAQATATMTVGTPYSATLSRPGGDIKLSFAGTAGQNLSLVATGNALAPSTENLSISVARPDGSSLSNYSLPGSTSSNTWTLPALPSTGTYTIYIEATGVATGSVALKLQ